MPDSSSKPRDAEPDSPAASPQSPALSTQSSFFLSDELSRWRREFPILDKTTYLISNSLGAMPRKVYESMRVYADTWATRGVRAWGDSWWEMPVELGNLLSPILGTGSGEVSFHQNVTSAEQIVLSCFDFRDSRRKVVLTDLEFPSVVYLYRAQSSRGAEIVTIPSTDGIRVDLERLLQAIDERTLLVPISHVLFRSAAIIDVQSVVKRAHDVGAMVVLDVYQSAGTIPIDVKSLDADFVIGGCLKWLCGGPGAAFLYVKPELRSRLEPRFTGWMAHRNSFGFETGDIVYRDDSFRFLNGTPHIPCLYAARPGLEIIGSIGVTPIRLKSRRQTGRLIELARAFGFAVTAPDDPDERGGTVALRCEHAYEVAQELLRREILVDFRPGSGIRISPHFYTTDSELEQAVHEIRAILDTGSWRRHEGARRFVT